MLQALRDNMKGAVAVFIVALMVIPLVLFGVDRIFLNTVTDPAVAEVNGDEISETDLAREISILRQQMRDRFGDSLPESFLSDENLRGQAMEELINRKLWLQAAEDGDMLVSNQRIDRMLLESPQYQRDGVFSRDLFRFQANNLGFTSTGFRQQIREDVSIDLLRSSLVTSDFVTEAQLQQLAALSNQTRDFYYLTVPVEPIRNSTEIDDAEAQSYYEENKLQFQVPERVVVDYLELRLADIAAGMEVTEEEVRAQYEEEVEDFDSNPEYRAAHILVEPKDNGGEQAILQEIQDKLAAGGDFADLAAEYSDDFGSKNSGGDLGFTQGETFPEEFEEALAALEVRAVSEPVETDAGFHIIKKLDERQVEPPGFEEERTRIARRLKEVKAEGEFFDISQQLGNMTYSAPDLQEASEILGLSIKTSEPFTRSGGTGIAANPDVVEAAFGDDVLLEGHNSADIEVGENHLVVLRLNEHLPERIRDFDEVKPQIVETLKSQQATAQLQVVGASLEQSVREGKSIEELAKENEYEWQVSLDTTRNSPQVRREILNAVFAKAPPGEGETVVDGLVDSTGGYVVYQLTEVKDGDYSEMTNAEKSSLRNRMQTLAGESGYGAYLANLRDQASIDIEE